ncbi:MAG TPA: CDP-diacylglycerol--serine O-phosphatidyltransferase [Candidatus Sulfotelmatobacter sp.]|nr:CDP-diacylglycerol--serine O-phosphatidyltransferase [Candidatus Sulfotelmatobacter sp.]
MMLHRRRPLRRHSINRLIPNILTLLALCAGLTAMRFALEQHFQLAVIAIVVAAVLDGLDGRIARLIGATSKFGAELDSLSDFVCFGVAPAVMLYLWVMSHGGRFGWAIVLLYAICTALRLARFNTALDDASRPAWTNNYFIGVPAPAGAGLAILPLIASFEIGREWFEHPWLIGAWTIVVSGLMVSRLPTFAFKRLRVPHWMVLPILLVVGVIAAGLAAEPWLTLLLLGCVYVVSIPLAYYMTRSVRGASAAVPPAAEPRPAVPAEPRTVVSISGGRVEPR